MEIPNTIQNNNNDDDDCEGEQMSPKEKQNLDMILLISISRKLVFYFCCLIVPFEKLLENL